MRRLTEEQANRLRDLRRRLHHVATECRDLSVELSDLCPHERSDPNCPACGVYWPVSDADKALKELGGHVDAALTRGPFPPGHPARRGT